VCKTQANHPGGAGRTIDRARRPLAALPVGSEPVAEAAGNPGGPIPGRGKARVLIGIRDLGFHQEVLGFLERDARLDVVGSVTDPGDLVRRLAHAEPDVTVLCPVMGRELSHPATARRARGVLLVAEEMTVPVLREAIDVGAEGVFAWPEERVELVDSIARIRRSPFESPSGRGRVLAVFGARGGAGATFLATHLAAAMADLGERTVLVDLDTEFADLTVALGIAQSPEVRTVAHLVEVADELAPDHLEDVLFTHPRGFSVLLGPTDDARLAAVPPALYPASIALLAGSFDVVVALVPRASDQAAKAVLGMADLVLLVLMLDLFSIYGARRAVTGLRLNEPEGKCRIVVNRAARSDLTVADVESILGIRPSSVIRFDRAVRRAQDRGELLSPRARRVGRDVVRLAASLAPARDKAPATAGATR
jgi:pilus assembly protein CpaE